MDISIYQSFTMTLVILCVFVKWKLLYLSESKFYSKYMHLSLSSLANIYLIGVLFAKKFSSVIDSESCACMVLGVFQYTDIQLLHLVSFSIIMSSTSYIAIATTNSFITIDISIIL